VGIFFSNYAIAEINFETVNREILFIFGHAEGILATLIWFTTNSF
jgi:hypothetical protein